jgi:hypothetical protein
VTLLALGKSRPAIAGSKPMRARRRDDCDRDKSYRANKGDNKTCGQRIHRTLGTLGTLGASIKLREQ